MEDIIAEGRELLQVIDDDILRLNRFRTRLLAYIETLETKKKED